MWVYKADLGLWEHQRSRRKTYRKIWCQGTETPEKTESYPGRNCKAKSMEKGKGCSQADQVEFRNRRLLVHADVQERLTATLETDAELKERNGLTDDLKNKIDIFFATGRITEEQYNELMDINKEERALTMEDRVWGNSVLCHV